jgi:tRNA (guanosine-2'-O-)-methyltransferase
VPPSSPHPLDGLDPARVCAVLGPLLAEERRDRIEEVLGARLLGLTVVLENLHDPHNGAAVLRSCEAAGVQVVHAIEGSSPFRFSSKVTQGCERWLDVCRHKTTAAAMATLRAAGFRLAAAVPGARQSLEELEAERPLALWMGNEHEGLSAAARAGADLAFGLPMAGMTRSLNLSVATALAVFAAAARRRAALSAPSDLTAKNRAHLRARWYFEDLRGAQAILRRAGLLPPA